MLWFCDQYNLDCGHCQFCILNSDSKPCMLRVCHYTSNTSLSCCGRTQGEVCKLCSLSSAFSVGGKNLICIDEFPLRMFRAMVASLITIAYSVENPNLAELNLWNIVINYRLSICYALYIQVQVKSFIHYVYHLSLRITRGLVPIRANIGWDAWTDLQSYWADIERQTVIQAHSHPRLT